MVGQKSAPGSNLSQREQACGLGVVLNDMTASPLKLNHPTAITNSLIAPARSVDVGRFATRREAMDEVINWLNFYNHKRLHSTLGYVGSMTFEQRWTAARQQDRKSA